MLEPDTNSEIDLTRHKHFLEDDGPPEDMRHLELVDPETDDRVFALLDNRATARASPVIGHGRQHVVSIRSTRISDIG